MLDTLWSLKDLWSIPKIAVNYFYESTLDMMTTAHAVIVGSNAENKLFAVSLKNVRLARKLEVISHSHQVYNFITLIDFELIKWEVTGRVNLDSLELSQEILERCAKGEVFALLSPKDYKVKVHTLQKEKDLRKIDLPKELNVYWKICIFKNSFFGECWKEYYNNMPKNLSAALHIIGGSWPSVKCFWHANKDTVEEKGGLADFFPYLEWFPLHELSFCKKPIDDSRTFPGLLSLIQKSTGLERISVWIQHETSDAVIIFRDLLEVVSKHPNIMEGEIKVYINNVDAVDEVRQLFVSFASKNFRRDFRVEVCWDKKKLILCSDTCIQL